MSKRAMVAAVLLFGCNTAPPELLPPPFGPEGPQPARLFFPTGLVQPPNGPLLVANGNFNRAFDSGTMVSIDPAYLASLFDANLDCSSATPPPGCNPQIPASAFLGAVLIGNYAGPIALSTDKTAAFTASRDTATINAVRIGFDGTLGCVAGGGNDAARDCRKGIIDLTANGIEGPYTIVPGDVMVPDRARPGSLVPQDVLFVSSIVPHIDAIVSGTPYTSTTVGVLSMADPSKLLFQMVAGGQTVFSGTGANAIQVLYGVGPMVFDRSRRRLYLSGCFQRSTALGAGEPGTGLCVGVQNNFLRIIDVDAGSAANPRVIDLRGDVLSSYTTQLLLDVADPNAAPSAPITTLWATMRTPDTLVAIDLPTDPSISPRVREVIPLPITPADMARIDRGATPPLIAVVAEKSGAVTIIDAGTSQVVAQVEGLGDSPFFIQPVSCSPSKTGSACLAATVFAECRIALIEVPVNNPAASTLRALAGSCP